MMVSWKAIQSHRQRKLVDTCKVYIAYLYRYKPSICSRGWQHEHFPGPQNRPVWSSVFCFNQGSWIFAISRSKFIGLTFKILFKTFFGKYIPLNCNGKKATQLRLMIYYSPKCSQLYTKTNSFKQISIYLIKVNILQRIIELAIIWYNI